MPATFNTVMRVGAKVVQAAFFRGQDVIGAGPMLSGMGFTTLLNARTNYIHPSVTASRAGPGMVQNEAGEWVWAKWPGQAVDANGKPIADATTAAHGGSFAPRRTYDPATGEYDFMFFGQTTNLVPDSETYIYQDTTSGGISFTEIGSGRVGDLAYRDIHVVGTATGVWVDQCNVTVLNGSAGAVAASCYGQLISGAQNSNLRFGVTILDNWASEVGSVEVITATPVRASFHLTTTTSTVALIGRIAVLNVGTAVDHVVRVWGAQLETGTIATPPIPTYGAQATCAADVWSWDNQILTDAGGTVVARYSAAGQSFGNRLLWWPSNTGFMDNGAFLVFDGVTFTAARIVPEVHTSVGSYGGEGMSARTDFEVISPYDGSLVFGTPTIGNNANGGEYLNGTINHLSVSPTQRSVSERAQLAAITRF